MEELQKRHRHEQRDLQARVTQKKKNASKKTRKGVNDECAELERALKERQQQELNVLAGGATGDEGAGGLELKDDTKTEHEEPSNQDSDGTEKLQHDFQDLSVANGSEAPSTIKKPNRQKARLARRAAEQEFAAAQAAEEAASLPDLKAAEKEKIAQEIKTRGLLEKDIRSDGHCLYAAVADQLDQSGLKIELSGMPAYKVVRREASAYIESHPEDFVPFLEEPLEEYVTKVRDTGEWGGQLELSALAQVYKLDVNVLQAEGRVEKIGTGGQDNKEIWLAYYRHSFGLGEHYNSLRRKP